MKKIILISIVSFTLVSCGTKEVKETIYTPVVSVEIKKEAGEFSNPSIIEGSSFGTFFISMLRTQNYDMALKFTSKESIKKFGLDKIRDKYENFKYNYKLKQKSIFNKDNEFTIVYATNELATCKLKKLIVTIENDSCKLVLPENIDDLLK